MRAFPFPDRIGSREELMKDILYKKIPKEDCDRIADRAWETGVRAANCLLQSNAGKSIEQIALDEGLKVEHKEKDNVVGNVRYFSEYYSGLKKIILYDYSIKKWSKANSLTIKEANELILSHEIYHHLECTKLGLTSDQYTVPMLKIGRFKMGKSGIRTLSEIGAHGFSRTYYEARGRMSNCKGVNNNNLLTNHAINDADFYGHNVAKKIFETNPILGFFTGNKRLNKN